MPDPRPSPLAPWLTPPDDVVRVGVDGVALHAEVYGSGAPLVLIAGLGGDTTSWVFQIPALARHFRVIAFDNRGAGRSDKPDAPYTIPRLADDLAALLDALAFEHAHVLGASMGGLVAQAFALRHPDRLARLMLACTTFGGPQSVLPDAAVIEEMLRRDPDPAENTRRAFRLFASPGWIEAHTAFVEAFAAYRVRWPQPAFAFAHQAAAVSSFTSAEWLGEITAPTLILHGTADRVIPVANAHLLAARLPDARLALFEGGGHLFFMETPDAFNARLLHFLEAD